MVKYDFHGGRPGRKRFITRMPHYDDNLVHDNATMNMIKQLKKALSVDNNDQLLIDRVGHAGSNVRTAYSLIIKAEREMNLALMEMNSIIRDLVEQLKRAQINPLTEIESNECRTTDSPGQVPSTEVSEADIQSD